MQLSSIFATGSIPGSSTKEFAGQGYKLRPALFVIITSRVPRRDLVDQRLCAENCCKSEALGVFGAGFGSEDHDPQIIGGDD